MKPNFVTVDAEMAKELGDCAVGDTKKMMVTMTVDGMGESGLTGTITAVEPYEAPEEPEAEEEVAAPVAGQKSKALAEAISAE